MHFAVSVAILVLILVGWVLCLVSIKPNIFRIARSVKIKAPPEALYPYVVDFHRWIEWSPWEGIDADLKRTYEGAASGAGAVYGWAGAKTGQGRMEIVEDNAPRHIGIKLDFMKPFEAHNVTEFTFEPLNDLDLGHVTAITWSMHGPSSFMHKLMSVFMNMDKMIGKDFEKGLNTLKALGEG